MVIMPVKPRIGPRFLFSMLSSRIAASTTSAAMTWRNALSSIYEMSVLSSLSTATKRKRGNCVNPLA